MAPRPSARNSAIAARNDRCTRTVGGMSPAMAIVIPGHPGGRIHISVLGAHWRARGAGAVPGRGRPLARTQGSSAGSVRPEPRWALHRRMGMRRRIVRLGLVLVVAIGLAAACGRAGVD